MQRLAAATRFHPAGVGPLIIQIPNYRGRAWRLFVQYAERVSLVADMAVIVRDDVELIERSLADLGNEAFPYSGSSTRFERM